MKSERKAPESRETADEQVRECRRSLPELIADNAEMNVPKASVAVPAGRRTAARAVSPLFGTVY
jgi:hypothetical protein